MSDAENSAASLVADLGTNAGEDAFHRLIELGPEVIPTLISAFRNEQRLTIRTRLIELIAQFRDPRTVGFLEEAFGDSAAAVWKASLDALASLGGPPAIEALRRMKRKELASRDRSVRLEWVNEALRQTAGDLG